MKTFREPGSKVNDPCFREGFVLGLGVMLSESGFAGSEDYQDFGLNYDFWD
jgi:hypothetical protein